MTHWLPPPSDSCIGNLTFEEHDLLQHYRGWVWQTFTVRNNSLVHDTLRDYVPQLSLTQPHLIYALLSLAASHKDKLQASPQSNAQALYYRQKTFRSYNSALQSITSSNYEAILTTSALLLGLVPQPSPSSPDDEQLDWLSSLLKMSEGLRILASLRWAQGIERLPIYPLICRELVTLPPPPLIDVDVDAPIGPLGTTPDNPNPAPTYKFRQPSSTRLFLPPCLMAILRSLISPPPPPPHLSSNTSNDIQLDLHAGHLKPVFHALSPIFLSLYYYHLNPDFCVRVLVFTSFLMPDFLHLVRAHEPRALVLIAWWLALASLINTGWWIGGKTKFIVHAVARTIRNPSNNSEDYYWRQVSIEGSSTYLVEMALRRVERIVDLLETQDGKEEGAKSVFEDWEGVEWEDGPRLAREWEFEKVWNGEVDAGDFLKAGG